MNKTMLIGLKDKIPYNMVLSRLGSFFYGKQNPILNNKNNPLSTSALSFSYKTNIFTQVVM